MVESKDQESDGASPVLRGINVISCEHAVAAPLATRHLADLGANVVKVERPRVGDFARYYDQTVLGQSSHFVWLNRGKRSLTVDLKSEEGRQIVGQLLGHADIFVQNLGPGAAQRLSLGGAALARQHPQLIVCEISGYGPDGPWALRKAYDLLVQSEVGLVGITGSTDQPAKAGIPAADIAAGMYALSGMLLALYQREKTGLGTVIEVSLLDSLAEWMGYPFYYARYGGSAPPRAGASHGAIAPYGPFRTSDGSEFVLAVQNDREWQSFCTLVIRRPDMAADPRFLTNALRVEHRTVLDDNVARSLALISGTEAADRCDRAHIAYGHMRDVGLLQDNPQLQARRRWAEVGSPMGPIASLLPPFVMDGGTPTMGPVPSVGEHTEQILKDLGYSGSQISGLRQAQII